MFISSPAMVVVIRLISPAGLESHCLLILLLLLLLLLCPLSELFCFVFVVLKVKDFFLKEQKVGAAANVVQVFNARHQKEEVVHGAAMSA